MNVDTATRRNNPPVGTTNVTGNDAQGGCQRGTNRGHPKAANIAMRPPPPMTYGIYGDSLRGGAGAVERWPKRGRGNIRDL